MNIHEYQAKEILAGYGIPVPNGVVIDRATDAERAAWKMESETAVVKAQIHSGGRGKAGGVKLARSIDEVKSHAEGLLGKQLVTGQTGPEGRKVRTLLIEEGCDIVKEFYLGISLDREASKPVIIASEEGGVDIEEVASTAPGKMHREIVDPMIGLTEFQARRLCYKINMSKASIDSAVRMILNLYRCFVEKDCVLLEVNPLAATREGEILALDAKMNFDENSLYRNKEILRYRDFDEEDEREIEASRSGLSYIAMKGNIGCMVNGAGLAMATMDMIHAFGGEPANFLDVGGGADEDKVSEALRIILSDKGVDGVFVNIFGGIMKCDVIARGIVEAVKRTNPCVPMVVRLEGTNVIEGKRILDEADMDIVAVGTMAEGAEKVVLMTA